MISLAFVGFGLGNTARLHLEKTPDSGFWKFTQYQWTHTDWVGCSFWDLIQPSFMFMVGLSMAYSYVKRKELGHAWSRMFGHALWRSVLLILLGVFLSSNWSASTNWKFMSVLSQIGLGYAFLFLLWGRTEKAQAITAGCLLLGTWLLYVLYPHSGIDLATGSEAVGVDAQWAQTHLAGVGAAWHKNANVGHAIDVWFLNLWPAAESFVFNSGGYQTINFLPSLATMIFGLMCGELIRSKRDAQEKLKILCIAGVAGLALGQILHLTGICPMVKRIWTPTWVIFSTGWCCLILASFYWFIDIKGYRRWAFPLVVVGMNSIAMYMMAQLLKPYVQKTLKTHFGGGDLFLLCGELFEPMVRYTLSGLVLWLVCYWMYRQKIFIRI
jgi:predicted acyltransferase